MSGQVGARLSIEIDSSQAVGAAGDLDRLGDAARRAAPALKVLAQEARDAMHGVRDLDDAAGEAAKAIDRQTKALRAMIDNLGQTTGGMNRLEDATREVDKAIRNATVRYDDFIKTAGTDLSKPKKELDELAEAHDKVAKASKMTAVESLKVIKGVRDGAKELANGGNLLDVFLNQGVDVIEIMQSTGVSFKSLGKEMGLSLGLLRAVPAATGAAATGTAGLGAAGAAAGIALTPLGLILIGVAAAAAVVVGATAVVAQQMNKTGESAAQLQARLGLSDAQMKQLKASGTDLSITMGDVMGGAFDYIGKKAAEAFDWDGIKKGIADFYQSAVDWTKTAIRNLVGLWGGFTGGLTASIGIMPAVVGEFAVNAVNSAIEAVNIGLKWITDRVNDLVEFANKALKLVRIDITLPELTAPQLGKMANQFEGAGARAGQAWAEGSKRGSAEALAAFDAEVKEWLAAIEKERADRVRKEAELKGGSGDSNATGGAGGRSGGAAGDSDYETMRREIAATAVMNNAATDAQLKWNEAVASGRQTIEEANLARDRATELARIEAEVGKENAKALIEYLDKQWASQDRLNKAKAEGDQLAANAQATINFNEQLEFLRVEETLIGASNLQRSVELAQLKERQEILRGKSKDYVLTDSDNDRIAKAGDVVRAQAALAIGQELYNKALDRTLDRLTQIDELVQSSADRLADAFEGMSGEAARFTRALGGILGAMNKLALVEEKVNRERRDSQDFLQKAEASRIQEQIDKAMEHNAEVGRRTALEMQSAQLSAYGNMAGAAKSFFKENSAGYKAMEAAETAFRAVEFAMSVRAMIQNATETSASVTNSGAKAAASATAGAAKFFEESGWFGFAGVAAMLAVLASLGFSSSGAGSGVSAQKRQERQGTGSVLGDADAKSESIQNALDIVAANTNRDLEYSNAMLQALRGIQAALGNVSAGITRALMTGGALDPDNVRNYSKFINHTFRGPRTSAGADPYITFGVLGGLPDFLGLHNTDISRKLVDSGIRFVSQTLGDVLAGGIEASFYQTVETTIKKKALGFTYSEKVKSKDRLTAIDDDLARELDLIVSGLRDGVLAAASVLGIDGAAAVLESFQLNLGHISFKGMKADEIEDALSAVFSKLGDDMAAAALPGLTAFQRAGEGLFETLMRVARQYQVIDATLQSVGMTFGAVGISSLQARENLVNLFGSLDDFVDQVGFYGENFLTEAERLAPIQAALNAELARLGITGLDTRDEFKALVQGLDLSTAAGAELFAALMAIAPAFAAVTEETEAIADARDALSNAYERESGALADTRDRFADLAASLGEYRASLYSGPTAALTPEQQYAASRAEFERVAALAAQGDEQALGDLESVSQAYLDASRDYYASSEGYFADLAAVRTAVTAAEVLAGDQVDVAEAQLDALEAMVDGILDLNETTLTVAEALAAYQAAIAAAFGGAGVTPVLVTPTTSSAATTTPTAPAAGAPANDNSAVVAELQALNASLSARLERLEAQQEAAMRQRGAVANAQLKQGDKLLEVQDQTVHALRAKA